MDKRITNNQLFNLVYQVDQKIEPFFTKKLPALPENIREILAKIAPYITIIGVILGAFALLAVLGLTATASPMVMLFGGMGATQALTGGLIGLIFLAAQIALQAMAIPGLLKRQRTAWYLLFAASLIGLIFDLITLNLFNLVVSFLLTFYLLYQIKSYYSH